MSRITLVYSTHRPETLQIVTDMMLEHDVIFLEEPPHPHFFAMLEERFSIEEYLMEQDLEYPEFSARQYALLRSLYRQGKEIQQIEPFLEHLVQIHFFFADGNAPDDLEKDSIRYQVYLSERDATEALLEYYKSVQKGNFDTILHAVKHFARADAERFRLRDTLRSKEIVKNLPASGTVFLEAGTIHVLLNTLLQQQLSSTQKIEAISVEHLALEKLNLHGSLFSPGDELTIAYLHEEDISLDQQDLLAARSLIYSKIVTKEEIEENSESYPHTRNEYEVIQLVNSLNIADCRHLFFNIRKLKTKYALQNVKKFINNKNLCFL